MISLVVATRNRHKVGEIQQILGGDFSCQSLDTLPGAPVPVEDAPTFAGNATKKVVSLAQWLAALPATARPFAGGASLWLLADDSGLEVDALGGAPGVHSARFAADDPLVAGNTSDAANNAKLLRLLQGVENRVARFRCVLALLHVKQSPMQVQLFEGICAGRIATSASGGGGFGYDPLFVPRDAAQTFAELGEDVKNKLSHRARALAELKTFFADPKIRRPA
jgi:XTP/dITP diphosphohydrolase